MTTPDPDYATTAAPRSQLQRLDKLEAAIQKLRKRLGGGAATFGAVSMVYAVAMGVFEGVERSARRRAGDLVFSDGDMALLFGLGLAALIAGAVVWDQ